MDDEQDLHRCAICGVTEGDAANLAKDSLQTNATVRCGHQFCNSCIEREFTRRREFPCPICRNPVKKVHLSLRTLDDIQCEKDTSWRRRVIKVFNKVQTDFATLTEYNDYLEEKEDIVFAIVNEEPNAEDAKNKIRAYEEENKAQIVIRQSQRADEERSIQDRIAAEQRDAERRKRDRVEEEKAILKAKRQFKQESTEVALGEREEVSADLMAAAMQGYKNELKRQSRGATATAFVSPKVREPPEGYSKEKKQDREFHRKRTAAGAGVASDNIASHERNWQETESSLFSKLVF